MKYLILIHSNPQFLERWEGLTDAQREEFGRGHLALADELAASGELVASRESGPASTSSMAAASFTVRAKGPTRSSDEANAIRP